MSLSKQPSEFKNVEGIEYFDFEEDFVEENIRCIPMIVRFKLDKVGIKLKLAEWAKFNPTEKLQLALQSIDKDEEFNIYRQQITELVRLKTNKEATALAIEQHPGWQNLQHIPNELLEECRKIGKTISKDQWRSLTDLQRFALVKLSRPGHENRNLPKALKEFGID